MIYWIIGILAALIIVFILATYIPYRMCFAVPPKHQIPPHTIPDEEQYQESKDYMLSLIDTVVSFPYEDVWITTADGLRLYGRYFETAPGAPVQISFHGYRSNAYRDFCGGLQLALKSGCNALLVDQRAHGKSAGKCLSFGVLERNDCMEWVNYVVDRCGHDVKITLNGVSMGAATIQMASELPLPSNVKGIVSDCGYSSPKEIIRKVICDMGCPLEITYKLVRLAGKIYGGFDLEAASATEAVSRTNIPILFIHGEDDRFVPHEMSLKNYDACASEKMLFTVPEAGHGLSYILDEKGYCDAVDKFMNKIGMY